MAILPNLNKFSPFSILIPVGVVVSTLNSPLSTLHSPLPILHSLNSQFSILNSPLSKTIGFRWWLKLFGHPNGLFSIPYSPFFKNSSPGAGGGGVHSQFSTLHSPLSTPHSPFFILHSRFSILHFPFSILHSQFSILHSSFRWGPNSGLALD